VRTSTSQLFHGTQAAISLAGQKAWACRPTHWGGHGDVTATAQHMLLCTAIYQALAADARPGGGDAPPGWWTGSAGRRAPCAG